MCCAALVQSNKNNIPSEYKNPLPKLLGSGHVEMRQKAVPLLFERLGNRVADDALGTVTRFLDRA